MTVGAINPDIQDIITSLKDKPGALLPILHGIQDLLGYVPSETVPAIADTLNLSRAEVHGVISFYHYFRNNPPGKTTVHVCRAESCQAMGAMGLERHIKQQLGIDYHETTQDGAFSLEPVYCLGLCASSPNITVGHDIHGKVTAEYFDKLIAETKGAV